MTPAPKAVPYFIAVPLFCDLAGYRYHRLPPLSFPS
jgi:hypothetical protein